MCMHACVCVYMDTTVHTDITEPSSNCSLEFIVIYQYNADQRSCLDPTVLDTFRRADLQMYNACNQSSSITEASTIYVSMITISLSTVYPYQLSQLFTYTSTTKFYKLTSVLNFFKAATDFSGEFVSKFCKTDSISKRLNKTHAHTRTHTHTHTHMHIHTHTHTHTHTTQTRIMHVCVHVRVCVCVHFAVLTTVHIHICMYARICNYIYSTGYGVT